ncbi:hypothetical protein A2377_00750 [Candidatus Roizmanbacteria bacterium RIFOXYB1_FULL_41_27]|nr:MAG: hypothetical protein A2377_00750 [Candidatus Roizmanbacteria bacterium RIFOXYB1_FULL_41_27]
MQQTYKDFEYLIIDDGSTDKTRKVVKKYLVDPRIHYVNEGKQEYYTHVRNIGVKRATGRLICFLDDDNWWEPTFLEDHERVHRQKDVAVTYSGRIVHFVDKGVSEKVPLVKYMGTTDALNGVLDVGDLMFKTALVKEVGMFSKEKDMIGYCSDLRLVDAVLEAHPEMKMVLIPKFLHNYRAHSGSMTQRKLADRAKGIFREEEQWKL